MSKVLVVTMDMMFLAIRAYIHYILYTYHYYYNSHRIQINRNFRD